jgi:glutamine amidotransferase-like uncharacterized protein
MNEILIYADQGVDGGGLKQLMRSLKQEVDLTQHVISRIDSKKLIADDWEKRTKLLIMPGGRDCFYHSALDGIGTDKIRAFVQNGGGYLGICAGGYFGCDRIEFEKGGPLEVCGARSLRFFPGVAKGPAYGNDRYSYESARGAAAAPISWGDETCHVYFNGGCIFEADVPVSDRNILSRYLDLSHPAIVKIPIGKGMAILSGVHFEYQPILFATEDPYLSKVSPLLMNAEVKRRRIFREIIGSYQIQLKNDDKSEHLS